jgi:hypothetical protein
VEGQTLNDLRPSQFEAVQADDDDSAEDDIPPEDVY